MLLNCCFMARPHSPTHVETRRIPTFSPRFLNSGFLFARPQRVAWHVRWPVHDAPVVRNMSIRSRGPLREKPPPPTGQIVMQRYRINIQVTNLHTVEGIVRRGERDSSRETEQISPEVRHTGSSVIYQAAATAERLQHGKASMSRGENLDLCSLESA